MQIKLNTKQIQDNNTIHNLLLFLVAFAVLTRVDFFNWLPDVSHVTGRARYEPLRILSNINVLPAPRVIPAEAGIQSHRNIVISKTKKVVSIIRHHFSIIIRNI